MNHPHDIINQAKVGLQYGEYMNLMAAQAARDPNSVTGEEAEKLAFTRLNLHRARRIVRTWRPSEELAGAMTDLPGPQLWLALTEPWCGDSAQCLPSFATLARARSDLDFRLLLRDDHPAVMDKFLTNGKRSIPVVVGFDQQGKELFRWGPRPAAAQAVFDEAKAEGLEKPGILERLHLFYGRNRGQALDAELTVLLRGVAHGR